LTEDRIHPYDEAKNFINNASFISVGHCGCRASAAKCNNPGEVCRCFDDVAEFLVERGFACQIDKKEAMKLPDMTEAAGLVHPSFNSGDKTPMICSCCPCCCHVLRRRIELKHRHAFESGRFEALVNGDECTGCSLCIDERCPMEEAWPTACIDHNQPMVIKTALCLKCCACIRACPNGVRKMTEKDFFKHAELPATLCSAPMLPGYNHRKNH
jgi:electron transport complex protein RnfB